MTMGKIAKEVPYFWPDAAKLIGQLEPVASLHSLLTDAELLLAVVHGLTESGVARLGKLLDATTTRPGDGESPLFSSPKKVKEAFD